MADISKIELENTSYDIKDVTARNNIATLSNDIQDKKILVFGDSWVADWSSVPVQNCWIYDVAKGLGILTIDCYATSALISHNRVGKSFRKYI